MIESFLKGLLGPTPPDRPEPDPRQMFAALLVRAARADDAYEPGEIAAIDALLAERYSLSPFEAPKLRRQGEAIEAEIGDTVHITKAIKDTVPYEERVAVIEALWRVVLADDHRDAHENAYLRLVVSLLGVRDVDSGQARQRAAAR